MPRRWVVLIVATVTMTLVAAVSMTVGDPPVATAVPSVASLPGAAAGLTGDSGELLYANEGNRMRRIDVDSIGTAHLDEDVLVPSAGDAPGTGRDVNGEICVVPDGSGRFLAGEDTGQTAVPAGWGLFDSSGTQVGKLTATYNTDGAEPHGCEFADDGTLFTSEVGFQGFGTNNGQLILWFPPFDQYPGAPGTYPNDARSTNFCKIATDLGTAGGVAVDDQGRVYVSESSGLRITRFSPPFPTGPDPAGGCSGTDATGAPQADTVQREVFVSATPDMLTYSGMAMAPNGNLYVASVLTGGIAEYDLDGGFVRYLLEPSGTTLPTPWGNPQGLAVGGDGSVYYADLDLVGTLPDVGPGPNGTIRRIRFDAAGDPLPPIIIKDDLSYPDGLTLLPGNLGGADPAPYEWPTLAGGDERQFFNAAEHEITPDNAAQLIERWRFPTGAVVTASPSIATVDIPGRGATRVVFASSWDRHVYAIDWATGEELWRFEWEDQPGASFPGAGSVTIEQIDGVPVAFFGAGEKVYAVDARTGVQRWQFAAGTGCRTGGTGPYPGLCGFAGERNQVESTPIVAGGTVYVGMDVNDVPLGKGGFYAIDARDGTMTWFFDPESGAVCRPDPSDEIRRYDGYHSEVELGLPAGFLLSRSGCGHPRTPNGCGNVWSSASLDDQRDLLFFATSNCDTDDDPSTSTPPPPMPPYDEALVALHLDGTTAWRWRPREVDPDDLAFGASPNLFTIEVAPGQSRDVVGVGGKDGTYYVLDREGTNTRDAVAWDDSDPSGLPYWSTQVVPGGEIGGIIQTAAVDEVNRRVLFATAPGFDVGNPQRPTVHALAMDTGSILWQNDETGPIDGDASYGPTSATQEVVAVGSVITPHLRLYDASDGELLVDRNIGEPGSFSGISSGVAFEDGTLVVGTGIGARSSGGSSPGDFTASTPSAIVALCAPGTPGCEYPTVTASEASVQEGDAGTTQVDIPVTLSRRYGKQVRVDWSTTDGTATVGSDVVAASGTVVFPPNATTATITVDIAGDEVPEDDEVALVQLSNPVDAVIGGFAGLGAVHITDDDRPTIVPGAVEVVEGDGPPGTVEVAITLSEASTAPVSVQVATLEDTARAPDDFAASGDTVTFEPGQTEATFALTIERDDIDEDDERLYLALSGASGATIGGFGLGVVTIVDDDTGPAVGLPGAPPPPVAIAVDGGAQVQWSPPADAGSSSVRGYRVTAAPGGGSCTWTSGPLRCEIDRLTNGTSYTFVVRASNDAGPGPDSAQSGPVTPSAPVDTWFAPLGPTRLVDSRPAEAIGGFTTPWGPGETRTVDIAGPLGGVVPAAVALNVTVTDTTAESYLAAWPTGSPRPLASTLNWTPGQTVANATIVPVGADGTVSVFNAAGDAHVVIDLVGTYAETNVAGFTPTGPTRVLDSRVPGSPNSSPWGPNEARAVPVTGNGVPDDALAVAVNVTVTDTTAASYLTLWETGVPEPTTSSVNWPAGTTVANSAIVPIGTDGTIEIRNHAGSANVILDVVGYYSATEGDAFHPIAPARVNDSRPPGIGDWSTSWAESARTVPIAGRGGVPHGATAVAANVTVVNGTAPSYLTLWPSGASAPTTSTINWLPSEIVANGAALALGGSGTIDVRNHAGSVDVIVDVSGWFG